MHWGVYLNCRQLYRIDLSLFFSRVSSGERDRLKIDLDYDRIRTNSILLKIGGFSAYTSLYLTYISSLLRVYLL